MTVSLREACSCIGLSGNISIVRDFYGYSSIPGPFAGNPPFISAAPGIEKLSLLQQVGLIKQGNYVRLHIRIFIDPGSPTIDQHICAMRQLYANIGIGVVIRSIETLSLPPEFMDIFVGYCRTGSYSSEMKSLFRNISIEDLYYTIQHYKMGAHQTIDVTHKISNEIVIFYVDTVSRMNPDTMKIGTLNGCTAYLSFTVKRDFEKVQTIVLERRENVTISGIVIGSKTDVWTLAHEVGHVFELIHVSDPNRLMNNSSPLQNPPPDLSAGEIGTIFVTGLNRHFLKKCGDP
jgi:hypothetical protein